MYKVMKNLADIQDKDEKADQEKTLTGRQPGNKRQLRNVLRANEAKAEEKARKYLLGTDILRSDVVSVIFLNTKANVQEKYWDISESGNESVIAWAETCKDGYVFFIAAEGSTAASRNCKNLFRDCAQLQEIQFNGCFDTSQATNMECMFYNCRKLSNLDLNDFCTGQVTNMGGMFGHCRSLEKLNAGNFDTGRVTNMQFMFGGCRSLSELNITYFDTSKVSNMRSMFAACTQLAELDIRNFDFSKAEDRTNMFQNCSKLELLKVFGFRGSDEADLKRIFPGCGRQLKIQDEEKQMLRSDEIQTGQKKKIHMLGSNILCRDICSVTFLNTTEDMPLDNWDVSAAGDRSVIAWAQKYGSRYKLFIAADGRIKANPNCRDLFRDCVNLRDIQFYGNFDTKYATDMSFMFLSCVALKNLDVSSFDTSKVTNMHSMFWNCSRLQTLNISGFHTSQVVNMESMFAGCVNLRRLDVSRFDTSRVKNMKRMFYGCSGLEELDVSGFQTSQAENMESMFEGCSHIKKLL